MKPALPVVLFALFTMAVLAPTAACTTTKAPGVCCIGAEDCARLGLTEDRPCPQGQACADFQCTVAACSTQGCAAEAPVCDVAADVCTGCTASADCSRFADTDVCSIETGACVECLAPADCAAAAEPVCDNGACRGCRLDAECPSGACGDDGACVSEAEIVYLSPTGTDAGTCTRGVPCRGLTFAADQTFASRNHLVMAPGTYDYGLNPQFLDASTTAAPQVFVHGSGSSISTTSDAALLTISVNATLRDLDLIGGGSVLRLDGTSPIVLERIRVRDSIFVGIRVGAPVTMRDVRIEMAGTGISLVNSGRLILDRGVIRGGVTAIESLGFGTSVEIANLMVFGTSDVALDLAMSSGGTIESTTIADSGTDAGSGPRAFRCPPAGLTIRSSIIWAPGTITRPPIDNTCTLVSTIAGPVAVPGATNSDPRFVEPAANDYHLSANSPARDAIDTGPSIDFEGDPRPRGARFDIGADESP